MGDEVSKRTLRAFKEGLQNVKGRLDASLNKEKENNDFLDGVPAIVEAIRSGKIECRVYRQEKFHAKAYITHARLEVVGSFALVGSSNFTFPGLNENVELNVQITGGQVSVLQEWYEEHWNRAEDVTPDILQIIERHTREYRPFDIFAKSLQEFFKGHELTAGEWEQSKSRMYPVLDQYQKDGYRQLMKIATQYGGAFLCDGVGLGKTYVGLMLIERLVEKEHKRVVLIVPKSARDDVWNRDIQRYLKHISGDFCNLVVYNHTDLLREGDFQSRLAHLKETADVIIIDEAHHFRNTGTKGKEGDFKSRYWRLYDIADGKTVYMLTATPINNRITDLQHMIELFSRHQPDYFKNTLGVHSLQGHFRKLENALEQMIENPRDPDDAAEVYTNEAEAEKVLWNDELFRALVIQRSRAYVKKSQEQNGGSRAIFPKREPPKIAEYQLKKTYGNLLTMVENAFKKDKPLFSLAVYYPLAYYRGPDIEKQKRAFAESRQREVVGLIRTLFLKRFESSARAFEFSCEALMLKLLAWVTKNSTTDAEKRRLERWKNQNTALIEYIKKDQAELIGEENDQDVDEDVIPEEMLEEIEMLSRDDYKVDEILNETILDLDEIASFLNELKKFKPEKDDKLRALIKLLKTDPVLQKNKVLIFSEYTATARYLKKELQKTGFADVEEVDSGTSRSRSDIIRCFAPYYNRPPTGGIYDGIEKEIRILISTDVLSEGLNLQDATRLINYDIHWNPVRLMQRIGRVDRRLNPEIEAQIIADHPEQKTIRGTAMYWNFLPPDELDNLLNLYQRVSHKTLRISKVFGIEGKKLLRPDDDFEALKEFNHAYEGTATALETMHLEYQQLLRQYPDLEQNLNSFPQRIFSGKHHPAPDTRAVFFCYALPGLSVQSKESNQLDASYWTEEAGISKWYLYNLATKKIHDEPTEIIDIIRSTPDTPRHLSIEKTTLSDIRLQVDRHIKNTYLKQVQAPIGVKQVLKAWMELS